MRPFFFGNPVSLPDLDRIAEIIKLVAEEEVVPRFGELQSGDIAEKRPGDAGNLVTTADLEAEKALTRDLEAAFAGSIAIGEEAIDADPSILSALDGDAPVWLIDPVDGTANFAAGREPFTILVSLIRNRETIAGWIYAPMEDRMAVTAKGEGAFCNGEPLKVAPTVRFEEAFGSAHAGSWGREYRDLVRPKFARFGEMVNYRCAGYDFLQLATGNKHFALYRALYPWDHAAGVLMHREAGGYMALLAGAPYSGAEKVRGLLAAPDETFWTEIVDYLKPI